MNLEKRTEGPRKAGDGLWLRHEPDDRDEQQSDQASGETGHDARSEEKRDWTREWVRTTNSGNVGRDLITATDSNDSHSSAEN